MNLRTVKWGPVSRDWSTHCENYVGAKHLNIILCALAPVEICFRFAFCVFAIETSEFYALMQLF